MFLKTVFCSQEKTTKKQKNTFGNQKLFSKTVFK